MNMRPLLDAAEFLRDERDIVFFIGSGHSMQSLRSEVERRGLAESFQFRPYQAANDLAQSLSLPDVHWISLLPAMEGLILPSKFYGVAAAGRPTIAVTDPAGEIAELVRRYQCGAVVTPGDGHAWPRRSVISGLTGCVLSKWAVMRVRCLIDHSARRSH
jgi:colanic acid biosynthesis glycosyl transferase WcaI